MKLLELGEEATIIEARMDWRKMGNKVKRAVRCTSGRRKGRVVSNPSQCHKLIYMKKRMTLRKTKARMGARMSRKSQRTKRMNPASRRLRSLNRATNRR